MSADLRAAAPVNRHAALAGGVAYLLVAILAGWLLHIGEAPDWAHIVTAVILSGGLLTEGLRSEWVRR